MVAIGLIALAAVFVGYAVWTQYQRTPTGESVPKRVLASLIAAGVAIGAAIAAWLHNVTAP